MNVGGAAPKEVSDEAREIALAVRGEVLAKLGEGVADFETFEVEPMCLSQVVAGTNFFFKYNVGDHASGPFIFARVVSRSLRVLSQSAGEAVCGC